MRMDKGNFFRPRPVSRADTLRTRLQTLEEETPKLSQADAAAVRRFLHTMDEVAHLFEALSAPDGPDLTPERLRFETVQRQVERNAGRLLKTLGGAAALEAARPAVAVPDAAPWWFLEQVVARRRAALRRRLLLTGGVAAALIALAVVLFNTLLKPDPAVVLKTRLFDEALTHVTAEGDYAAALASVEQILAVLPDDVETLVFQSVLLERLDRPEEAEAVFRRAQSLGDSPEMALLAKGQLLWQLGDVEGALGLAQQVVAQNPESAAGWFLAGQAHAALNHFPEARDAFTRAADLARAQGNDPLFVQARVNLGYLLPSRGE